MWIHSIFFIHKIWLFSGRNSFLFPISKGGAATPLIPACKEEREREKEKDTYLFLTCVVSRRGSSWPPPVRPQVCTSSVHILWFMSYHYMFSYITLYSHCRSFGPMAAIWGKMRKCHAFFKHIDLNKYLNIKQILHLNIINYLYFTLSRMLSRLLISSDMIFWNRRK